MTIYVTKKVQLKVLCIIQKKINKERRKIRVKVDKIPGTMRSHIV